ncbi:MFS transporter [Citrobacter portucalensis]|uniref:MFS transporter n=1 Tax=Citrobacter portucalensis TaxID=1639133 RepID=UPI001C63CBB6|nr:MFS transporter [Citrobacter portucalensis]MBW7619534.1 MFS transporter [Citrobacter portucalensis]MBW7638854.1 MFS transporter [Citrobacter portucalensis]MCA2132978.1 MFS transporter [Citrobacter portucalensis]MCA2143158.1 MFS transporter [Citrobacter portucalensis]MCA2148254.1 MFS transporter [Citrobacter portucalensis]
MKNKKIFYGWWIVLACFLNMSLIYASVANLVSLFIIPVTKELNCSVAQFTTYFTVMALASIFTGPVAGSLIKTTNIKLYLLIFNSIAAISFLGFSFATQVYHFYIFAVLMGIGMVGGSLIPVSILVTNWFNEKRGLCLGIALAGSGFGGATLSPLINWIITTYSWRSGYLTLSILIFIILIPLAIFVIKLTPADKGLLPLGITKNINTKNNELIGITQSQALKSLSFWALSLAIFISGIIINSMLIYLTPILREIGVASSDSAIILSLASTMVIFAKLGVGRLFDKIGLTITLLVVSVASLVSLIFLSHSNMMALAILFCIFTGIGSTAITVTPAYTTSALFGQKEYGAKYGTISIFISLGAAVSPVISGIIYGINQSYSLLIDVLMALTVLQFTLFFISVKTKPKFGMEINIENKQIVR